MRPLALYCKSYSVDLRRVQRLALSVQRFNQDRLPFFVSVPAKELELFKSHLHGLDIELLADEEIIDASARIEISQVQQMPGSIAQQVVKSEFWRLGKAVAYVCLDSDALFIRPFSTPDFLDANGIPYTVIDEAHDLLEGALQQGRMRILSAFTSEANTVQSLFHRQGKHYSFGPFPLVWHRDVWESLDTEFLQPRNMNFADAITMAPIESRWYGEALLAYKAIPLNPCQALFKVYHYAWQYDQARKAGVNDQQLAALYCGVIYQSAWERHMDWPQEGGNLWSRLGRRLRRALGRI